MCHAAAVSLASAGRITAVTPYYPYVRSDKKDEPRISITARLCADLIETAGADRVLRRFGLYCSGCHHSTSDSIEMAARQHGLEPRRVELLLKELNRAFPTVTSKI